MSRAVRVFQIAGDEVSMGRQLGALMRGPEATETLRFFADMPRHLLGGGRRDRGRGLAVAAVAKALKPGLVRLDRARPAALRARTEAFIAALGRPAAERLGLVALDASQNAIGLLARAGLAGDASAAALAGLAFPGACSSFAAWAAASEDGRLLHGRNFDLPAPAAWTRAPAVVFCQPQDGLRYGFVTSAGADIPGVTAFNEAGLTVTAHTRFHQRVSFDGISIVDLGHLIVRSARSLVEAAAIAARQRVASSWALVVSSARERRAISIEVHAGRVAIDVAGGDSYLAAANRNQVPAMQPGEVAPSAAWVRYSTGRLAVMRRTLDGLTPGRGLDVAGAKALLCTHEAGDLPPGEVRATGDCLAQSITIQSVVVDPVRELIHVAAGDAPSSRGPWVEVPWRWDAGTPESTLVSGEALATGPYREGVDGLAFAAFMRASQLETERAPSAQVRAAIEEAVSLRPEDPSYRHLAGGLALRDGELDTAAVHLDAALHSERSAFRRSELLRWAATVARWAGRPSVERARRAELRELLGARAARTMERAIEQRRRPGPVGVDLQLLTITP